MAAMNHRVVTVFAKHLRNHRIRIRRRKAARGEQELKADVGIGIPLHGHHDTRDMRLLRRLGQADRIRAKLRVPIGQGRAQGFRRYL